MGQKASTPATSGQQSPRSRTFSSSSTGATHTTAASLAAATADTSATTGGGAAVGNRGVGDAGQGFNLLRTLPGLQVYHHQQQQQQQLQLQQQQQHNNQQNSTSIDRQRARSLSSVPDIQQQQQQHQQQQQQQQQLLQQQQQQQGSTTYPHTHPAVSVSVSANSNSSFPAAGNNNRSLATTQSLMQRQALNHSIRDMSMTGANIIESITLASSTTSANGIGRVYTATSLPSHIWSFNGIKCPVCNKFVLPDDIECHLVMCLTKPRLSYNEDTLMDAKGECVICLEDLSPGDTIARLPCLCIYHKSCIDRWFEVNRSCPEHPGD
ncbi:hypothetical protein KR215_007650 [Drosophila sulfurigaster]|uniref:E3 ubiquitin-protein ligase znrf2 n=1 Tax=Drosophila sulfurigaster albostrigata TaxID=89887 RepID=UPI002D219E69|nr:E3 ubiquitin-protein ligase znrf2 [Drosophila sulfurigaster albostrigata]KAH8400116.1 hypothetical protein KR215_007650 [Drosophila sulfurigaster]